MSVVLKRYGENLHILLRQQSSLSLAQFPSVLLGPNLINWIRIKEVKAVAGRWSNGTLPITRVTPGHRGRDQ